MTTDYEEDSAKPVGYILAMQMPMHNPDGSDTYVIAADWDGVVYSELDAAWAECGTANGENWRNVVATEGITEDSLRMADYLPYAMFLAVPKPPPLPVPTIQKKSVQRSDLAQIVEDSEWTYETPGDATYPAPECDGSFACGAKVHDEDCFSKNYDEEMPDVKTGQSPADIKLRAKWVEGD